MSDWRALAFRMGDQDFAVDIRQVREVIAAPDVTALPNARPPVAGVFNLRGHIVTAVDGWTALGVPRADGRAARAVVGESNGRLVGLLVESATDVITVRDGDVRDAPHAEGSAAHGLVRGIVLARGRPVILLHFSDLLTAREAAPRVNPPVPRGSPS